MGDQVIYLEKFVEHSAPMPAELNRILKTIKELDLKSEDLGASIQENFDTLIGMVPGKASAEEVTTLRKRIEEDQALLIQWAEEKVQLALTGHELLDTQMAQLETDLAAFRDELTDQGIEVGEGYAMDDYPMDVAPPEPVGRRSGGARLGGYGYDALEPQASLGGVGGGGGGGARKSTQIPLSLSRQQSGYGSEGGYGTGSEAMGWDAGRRGGGGGGGSGGGRRAAAAGGGDAGYNSRRRAASAAVHATAAAVAALDEDDGGYGAAAAAGVPGEQAPILEPYVPGLQHFSKSPQAPGRPLTEADISPALVGRIAEVFWPDEANPTASMWYLVKIETVNMATKTAVIRYQNGEMEPDLSLVDVARDQHMMLVTM